MPSSCAIILPPLALDLPCHLQRNAFVHDMIENLLAQASSTNPSCTLHNYPNYEALTASLASLPVGSKGEERNSRVYVCREGAMEAVAVDHHLLLTFHDSDYLSYMERRERDESSDGDNGGEKPSKILRAERADVKRVEYLHARERDEEFGLVHECSPYRGFWHAATSAVHHTFEAVKMLRNIDLNVRVALNWFGGRHHAHVGHASGFCFLNDVVLAALDLKKAFKTVLIVDLDAHHGDGTQAAFYYDRNVFTLSVHADGEFPHSGALNERGGGDTRTCLNIPVPVGSTIDVVEPLVAQALQRIVQRFEVGCVVVVCGADSCQGDPIGALNLSAAGLQGLCRMCMQLAPKTLILGAGGYVATTAAQVFGCVTQDSVAYCVNGSFDGCPLASSSFLVPETLHYFAEYKPTFTMGGLPPARVPRVVVADVSLDFEEYENDEEDDEEDEGGDDEEGGEESCDAEEDMSSNSSSSAV